MQENRNVIGLIPAAGQAARIAPLPCSKELFPIGFESKRGRDTQRPRVICEYLLERLRIANISRVFIILRKGKWDIPSYLEDGAALDMHIGYLMMGAPFGSPYTLDQAWPFVQNARIALGFPDMIFSPKNAFVRLLRRQEDTGADVVLGLFPSQQPHKMDMVEVDADGKVKDIIIKPIQTTLHYAWIIALWNSRFTQFMHEHLIQATVDMRTGENQKRVSVQKQELYVGDIIRAGMRAGLLVESETFADGYCVDIGTPSDLISAIRKYGLP